jgi:hypothetical protein
MAIWNGKGFTDYMPLTQAAQARAAARKATADQQPCGCDTKPATTQRTNDALPLQLGDNRGFWRISKPSD